MNRKPSYRLTAAMVGVVCLRAAASNVSPSERERALSYLNQTRDAVTSATKGLSDAQLKFKPAGDRWSVAEVVEHLALIEEMVNQGVFGNLQNAQAPAAGWDAAQVDALVLAKVPDRSTKFQAPEPAVPTDRWTPAETLEHFLGARTKTVAFLKGTPDLRAHVINHPVFGPLDGYQWILALAAHTDRHIKQILEVKADPGFPKH